jgi:uncharacterized protein YjbJ (UPF0337 family)
LVFLVKHATLFLSPDKLPKNPIRVAFLARWPFTNHAPRVDYQYGRCIRCERSAMSETDHLPNRKVKSDTDLVIDTFVDDLSGIHPDLDREKLRQRVSTCVQEYVPDEDEGEEEDEGQEEEKGAGATNKIKGLAKQAAGLVTRNEETKAEGRAERKEGTAEGNKPYFRGLIEETNRRANSGA